ncbi:MAG: RNA polymerase sigma factor [Defluviitaleaceae bacterium]|nr:RNA polymerase sigma factor [Defluviitaleaceae bacterium]
MQIQSNRPADCTELPYGKQPVTSWVGSHAAEPLAHASWMEAVIKKHQNKLYRTALAIMGTKADAEDIVQDAFIKLFEKQQEFESADHEAAWLIRVTVNLCKNRLRSYWWRRTVPLLDTYPAKTDGQLGIVQAIMALPSKYRGIIHLYYYEGYSTKEIAEITSQKESAVRQQLTRARRKLKDFLGEQ